MKMVFLLILILTIGYLCIVLLFAVMQNRLIYFPSRVLPSPASLGIRQGKEIFFLSSDGVKICGWFLEPPPGAPLLLHFHGNAGNIAGRAHLLDMACSNGWGMLLFDYRGYGKSSGAPEESGLYLDAQAAWDWLTAERGIRPARIIFWAESLGCSIALNLAVKETPAGLILEAPFTSLRELSKELYPWLPVSLFLCSRFENRGKINLLKAPLLIIHGRRDEIVPFQHGKTLYELAQGQKYFLALNSSHNDIFDSGGNLYQEALRKFVQCCMTEKAVD
jgi:fermentation-respiration switch protein FrsA (DUF1100 family)